MGPLEAQGRAQAALGKLAAALSAVRFAPGTRGLESELARVLVRAAFVLVAEKRALLPPTLHDLHGALASADEDAGHLDAFARLTAALEGAGDRLPSWLLSAPVQDGGVRALLTALIAMVDADDDPLAEIERLGTAYESLLAAGVEVAGGTSLALARRRKAGHAESATLVDLDRLLARRKGARRRSLERRSVALTPRMADAVARAECSHDLAKAFRHRTSPLTPGVVAKGQIAVVPAGGRRSSGSHYTKASLTARVVGDVLAPLLGDAPTADAILALRICDPAMGSGAFLLAACEHLASALVEAWGRSSDAPPDAHARARRLVAARCLFGVDKDPVAVELARRSLWLFVRAADLPLTFADEALAVGDALLGPPLRARSTANSPEARAFDWKAAFPAVFDADPPGFDAMVGNPPWISYAGRAAQPLRAAVRAHFAANYESFAGYRNLQGLFIERAASLLRPGGRLGFIVPSSMSELDGYAPTRAAHDRLCAPDTPLRDLGAEEFPGVFQPCMALVSTRRAARMENAPTEPWPLDEALLDDAGRALLAKLGEHGPLPAHLFGERGVQTSGADTPHLRASPNDDFHVPLRAGSDIAPFQRKPPSFYCDPQRLSARLRPDGEWRKVAVLVRQTARVPMATLSDGLPFRNSILAGFADAHHPAPFLVAYLNATPIRWLHYARHRDARHGMPQLKVSHLRRTPRPPRPELVGELAALGERLSSENAGVDARAQDHLDAIVARAFALSEGECSLLRAWRERMAL